LLKTTLNSTAEQLQSLQGIYDQLEKKFSNLETSSASEQQEVNSKITTLENALKLICAHLSLENLVCHQSKSYLQWKEVDVAYVNIVEAIQNEISRSLELKDAQM
jgi:uncharacterized coiled-coil DUF342 family protein